MEGGGRPPLNHKDSGNHSFDKVRPGALAWAAVVLCAQRLLPLCAACKV